MLYVDEYAIYETLLVYEVNRRMSVGFSESLVFDPRFSFPVCLPLSVLSFPALWRLVLKAPTSRFSV